MLHRTLFSTGVRAATGVVGVTVVGPMRSRKYSHHDTSYTPDSAECTTRITAPVVPHSCASLHAASPPVQQSQPARTLNGTEVEIAERTQAVLKFYDAIRETKGLPPTKLGYGGSEHILNNDLFHKNPWQASCVELREKPEHRHRVLSYEHVDFASLPNYLEDDEAAVAAKRSRTAEKTTKQAPELEVVHYYETSCKEGLAGYQSVSKLVAMGMLPGRTENDSASKGCGTWIVARDDYVKLLTSKGMLDA